MGDAATPPRAGWYPGQTDRPSGPWGQATRTAFDAGVRRPGAPAPPPPAPGTDGPRHGQGRDPGKPPRSGGGFWTSLPGVLTAVAAVVTAAGGILLGTSRSDDDPPAETEPQIVVVAHDLGVDEGIEPAATTYGEYTTVTDDSGTIVVDVPVEWADVDGSALVLDDGTEIADVAASTDMTAYVETWGVPGVEVSATDTGVIDVPRAMAELAPSDCTSAGSEPYEDPVFTGEIAFYTGCAGSDTTFVLVAASYQPEPDRIAIVRAQILTDADVDAVARALDTFAFTS